MSVRMIRAAAVAAAAVSLASASSAALTTYQPWIDYWPNQGNQGNGIDNVLFNVQSANGVTVAMGAHAYKNSEFLPNDGVSTFYAQSGTYAGPPAEPNRANWSFNFAWDFGTACATPCVVSLFVDVDPGDAVSFRRVFALPSNAQGVPAQGFGSYNMEMNFSAGNFLLFGAANEFIANPYDFNPFTASSTAFRLEITRPVPAGIAGVSEVLARSDITVNVPEPGTLAMAGLALAGLAGLRRRRAA